MPLSSSSARPELPPALASLFDRYNEFLMVDKGSADNTVDAYRRDLRRYLEGLAAEGIGSIDAAGTEHVRRHVAALAESGLARRSQLLSAVLSQ